MIFVNGTQLEIKKFPNNEKLINDIRVMGNNTISMRFESDEDFIHLMFVKKHIDEKKPKSINKLNMYYIPYSRMDRTEGETIFTLKYIADFINSLNFDQVLTYEAHSNVSLALFDRITNVNYSVELARECMEDIDFDKKRDYIVFPDEGATKRYKNDFSDCNILTCKKVRNFHTGEIESLKIEENVPHGRKAIIVDDLCSYGRTFVLAAHELDHNACCTTICLCITHSEPGLYLGNIFKDSFIDKVYTTDSICDGKVLCESNADAVYIPDKIALTKLLHEYKLLY